MHQSALWTAAAKFLHERVQELCHTIKGFPFEVKLRSLGKSSNGVYDSWSIVWESRDTRNEYASVAFQFISVVDEIVMAKIAVGRAGGRRTLWWGELAYGDPDNYANLYNQDWRHNSFIAQPTASLIVWLLEASMDRDALVREVQES